MLSTLLAAVPVVVLLGALGIFQLRAHVAALLGLVSALVVAVGLFGMPVRLALATAGYGAAYGLFPIGWIILNVLFLYQLTQQRGLFTVLRESITSITRDRRLQLLLVAFCFGAFFEGASGFGTPVAVTGAILMGLGFSPLLASGLSLIANTAPVAFGALGTPIIALQSVTGLDLLKLSAMAGRQLPFFSVIVPFWLVWAFAGRARHPGRVAGRARRRRLVRHPAVPRLEPARSLARRRDLVGRLDGRGRALPAVLAAAGALGNGRRGSRRRPTRPGTATRGGRCVRAWMPWMILSVVVFIWGLPQTKAFLDGIGLARFPVPGLHNVVQRVPPVVARPTAEPAVYNLNWLSATGSGILVAALIGGLAMGYRPRELARVYFETLKMVRHSLLTIAAMLALASPRGTPAWTRRSGSPSRAPACSIRSSGRCWAGWAWP